MKNKTVSAFTDDAMGSMDMTAMVSLLQTGDLSAHELVEAAIKRANQANPILNGIVTDTFREAADQVANIPPSPFAGIPSFVKDNDDVEGVPTLRGSRAVARVPARASSEFVRQFQALGLVSLGKTSMSEFGLTATTEPLANDPARNPWQIDCSTGGSSGGAAALVAAGVVPIAHANDGGGSIRIPAACCGLVGLKPSRSRLADITGSRNLPLNILNHGVVTRSVRDTANFYAEAERLFPNPRLMPIGQVTGPAKNRLKIGYFTETAYGTPVDREVVEAVHATIQVCEELGHRVSELPLPFDPRIGDDFFNYWAMMAFLCKYFAGMHFPGKFEKRKLETLTHGLSRHYLKNIFKTKGMIKRLRAFAEPYEKLFHDIDVLITPVTAMPSPKLGYLGPELPFEVAHERLKAFVPYTPIQNIAGAPAVSLPLGRTGSGLPIGVQLATGIGLEKRLLELSFELEQAMPWPILAEV